MNTKGGSGNKGLLVDALGNKSIGKSRGGDNRSATDVFKETVATNRK